MSPVLGILLLALRAACQDLCTSPGALPAPTMILSPAAARPGDLVLLQCIISSKLPVVRVIFCRDEQALTSRWASQSQLNYTYVLRVSEDRRVNYSCKYESGGEEQEMKWSGLSAAKQLHGEGAASAENVPSSPGLQLMLPLAIAVPCLLLLAALGVLLGRKAVSALRTPRSRGENRAVEPPGEDLHYASVTARGRPRYLRGDPPTTTTYANVVVPREGLR